jgi:hypothetical protein
MYVYKHTHTFIYVGSHAEASSGMVLDSVKLVMNEIVSEKDNRSFKKEIEDQKLCIRMKVIIHLCICI